MDMPVLSEQRIEAISQAETMRDLLPTIAFIRLEVTPDSVVSEVSGLLANDVYLYVLDRNQNIVFQFTRDGAFVRRVMEKGEGPGELESGSYLSRHADGIAVSDNRKSCIFLYDDQGRLEKTLNTYRKRYLPNGPFVFLDKQTLLLANVPSHRAEAPAHIVLAIDETIVSPLFGFGRRHPGLTAAMAKGIVPRCSLENVARVGETLWIGNGCESQIEIYDYQGRLLKKSVRPLNGLRLDDYETINLKDRKERMKLEDKSSNHIILPVEDVVIVGTFSVDKVYFRIFDRAGNQIRENIEADDTHWPLLYSDGSEVFGVFDADVEYVQYYENYLSSQELTLLKQSGWKPNDFFNDNPYIVVSQLADRSVPAAVDQKTRNYSK